MRQTIVGNTVRKKKKNRYLNFVNERKAFLTNLVQQKCKGKRIEKNCNSLLLFVLSYYKNIPMV